MNQQEIENTIKAAVTAALEPLKAQVAKLEEAMSALLNPLAKNKGANAAKEAVENIGIDIMKEIGVVGIGFDGDKPWFMLQLASGKTLSVKRQEFDYRLRLRMNGDLLTETKATLNGLPQAVKAIVA